MANNRRFESRFLVATLLLAGIAGSASLADFTGSAVSAGPESTVVTSADDKWDSVPHTPGEGPASYVAVQL
ncbi:MULTISPECIES: hypothetical protein [unclassified Streptomyces]|uniref:hypothetical protein n=1 Tax=unclassified Streptomyces TaxID=2593676 RepID=UPI002E30BBC2|nr:hypothetical protein [Streptomyces sp. NBC_01460]WSS29018.1 hypothetical protein OG770_23735 [Streptomyces sp. NBC_01185]